MVINCLFKKYVDSRSLLLAMYALALYIIISPTEQAKRIRKARLKS